MRNGVRITLGPDTEPGPIEIGHEPVPLADYERDAIREILDGASEGYLSLRNSLRAPVLLELWECGSAPELLRIGFDAVWSHDYAGMLTWFRRVDLKALLKAARFPIDHIPERVAIYRGAAMKGGEVPSRSGISWTLRRDLACWFASHLPYPGSGSAMFRVPPGWTSYLLTATVRRERVAAHLTGRNEDEVIVFGMSAKTVSLTSDAEDIGAGEARESERRRAGDPQIMPNERLSEVT